MFSKNEKMFFGFANSIEAEWNDVRVLSGKENEGVGYLFGPGRLSTYIYIRIYIWWRDGIGVGRGLGALGNLSLWRWCVWFGSVRQTSIDTPTGNARHVKEVWIYEPIEWAQLKPSCQAILEETSRCTVLIHATNWLTNAAAVGRKKWGLYGRTKRAGWHTRHLRHRHPKIDLVIKLKARYSGC